MLSQSSGEGDHGLALSSTRTAVLLLQPVYTRAVRVASFSLSAMTPADLSILKWVSFSHESGQPASKPAAGFKASQVANQAITYTSYVGDAPTTHLKFILLNLANLSDQPKPQNLWLQNFLWLLHLDRTCPQLKILSVMNSKLL